MTTPMLQLLAAALLLLAVQQLPSAAAFDVENSCAAYVPQDGSIPSHWAVKRFTLVITDGEIVNLRGRSRPAVLVNGSTPGPRIDVDEFDFLLVTVVSRQLRDNMTGIHWHGQHQHQTPYSDGSSGVAQCGIPPGQSFLYRFCAYPAGTYWCGRHSGHSTARCASCEPAADIAASLCLSSLCVRYHGHNDLQYPRGLLGTFVVNPKNTSSLLTPSMYAQDWSWMAADFYNTDLLDIRDWFLSPASQGADPLPDGVTVSGAFSNVTHLYAAGTDRVLIRLINSAALNAYEFSIDGLDMTVVSLDGSEIFPYTVSSIFLNVAQRATVVVDFSSFVKRYPHKSALYYRVTQQPHLHHPNAFNPPYEPDFTDNVLWFGVIHVNAAANDRSYPAYNASQTSLRPPVTRTFKDSNALQARPLNWNSISYTYYGKDIAKLDIPHPTSNMKLEFDFHDNGDHVNRAYMNGVSFRHPGMERLMYSDSHLPTVYHQIVNASTYVRVTANHLSVIRSENNNTSLYQVPYGEIVEIEFHNKDDSPHPFHLHGHHFWITYSSAYPAATRQFRNEYVVRDTVTVPGYGRVVIRVPATNPGSWMLHCHIDWHLLAGLGVLFVEGTEKMTPAYVDVPQDQLQACMPAVRQRVENAEAYWYRTQSSSSTGSKS